MSHEVYVFAGAAVAVIGAGLVLRGLTLADNESMNLTIFDCTKDLFLAAVAVFPTTLIIEPKPGATIDFHAGELLATFLLLALIALWAKGDTRYFYYWRRGEKRTKQNDGKLGPAATASHPRLRKAAAFAFGNGLGFSVLFASTALSHHVASLAK
ncbi:MAG TPA: hypothetical protein VGH60_03330 [Solirubrobacteraceae bacterium]